MYLKQTNFIQSNFSKCEVFPSTHNSYFIMTWHLNNGLRTVSENHENNKDWRENYRLWREFDSDRTTNTKRIHIPTDTLKTRIGIPNL